MTMARLWGEGVTVARGGVRVLEALSFSVRSSQALVLTGPNGAGKTTLLRAIAGLNRLESGTLSFDRPDRGEGFSASDVAEACHFVGHLPAINGRLTLAENLQFWQAYLASEVQGGSIVAALSKVGLSALAHLQADVLSAGQRRRLALARLHVAPRPIWLLDEPTTALDSMATSALYAQINDHTSAGGIAVIATHHALGLDRVEELRLQPLKFRDEPGSEIFAI